MTTTKYIATFTEGLLATKPNDTAVHATYVAGKEREAAGDELDAAERTAAELSDLNKGVTVFHRDEEGNPIVWNYQLKGFLKEAAKALRRDPTSAWADIKAFKSIIDGDVFVEPRKIRLQLPKFTELSMCERPLRANTPQGERVALAASEEAPAGTKIEFSVTTLMPGLEAALDEAWAYARLRFMGAWRNSGKGTAIVEKVVDNTDGVNHAKKRGKSK